VLEKAFGSKELLPLWVADMDFRAPKPIVNALKIRAEHGIYGYSTVKPSLYKSIINWFQRRYNWAIDKTKKPILFTPGVIPALDLAVRANSYIGDKIIVQNPVYYPFYGVIQSNGRQILRNPLKFSDGRYEMDFEDLKNKVKDPRAKMLILCNPHNPIGRVWSKEELIQMGEICIENDILVVADEIHCDLIFPGYKHTNFASINETFAEHSITCTSVSKTFNLAGLHHSTIIISNEKIKQNFINERAGSGVGTPNMFGFVAAEAAYNHCDYWLDALMIYLQKNLDFLRSFIKDNLPKIKLIEPEGTYLVWLDCREMGMEHKELETFMRTQAKVALDEGYIFGEGGEGFERINIACPRSILEKALIQVQKAVEKL
jgi:cystathionine beta-lyase